MNPTSLTFAGLAAVMMATAGNAGRLSDVAGRYTIQPSSSIRFSVAQIGGGGIDGAFVKFSGTFDLHPRDISRSRVVFTLRPASIVTGEPRVENFLRSVAVFDAAAYPVITFRSIKVVPSDADSATIDGILSARGQAHEETFRATLIRHDGRRLAFHVVGDVLRSRYGMDIGTPIYSNVVKFDMIVRGERS